MKYTQEQVREALMRLSMCARKECEICKYKDRPKLELPSDDCKERSTKNMNILADVCLRADHPTEKCGSCEWAMPIKGTINGVYVSYIECQNPEKVWNHNSSRRKKRTTPKCRFWQPKKKGGVQEC